MRTDNEVLVKDNMTWITLADLTSVGTKRPHSKTQIEIDDTVLPPFKRRRFSTDEMHEVQQSLKVIIDAKFREMFVFTAERTKQWKTCASYLQVCNETPRRNGAAN